MKKIINIKLHVDLVMCYVPNSRNNWTQTVKPEDVAKGTGPISRTPALMENYGTDPVFNDK